MIRLSKRLKCIASYVSDGMNIVDIGCDHALLDIYLCQVKKDIKIIASDINQNAKVCPSISCVLLSWRGSILSSGLQSPPVSGINCRLGHSSHVRIKGKGKSDFRCDRQKQGRI